VVGDEALEPDRESPLAALRRELLASPTCSIDDVRAGNERDRLLTVEHDGRTVVPAFQLTCDAEIRPEISAMLAELAAAGLSGWSIWAWMTAPTSWLSGEVPERVAATEPQRALHAARRRAAAADTPAG
jgi:hypothetical protein